MTVTENAASVRAYEAVSAYDATDHLSEHGLSIANPAALEAARRVVESAVAESLGKINDYLNGMKLMRQNPYRDAVKVGGREVRFAAAIELFAADALKARVDATFESTIEGGPLEKPNLGVLSSKIARELGARLREPGFIVVASDFNADGSLSRIALRDPVYAEGAAKQRNVSVAAGDVAELAAALRNRAGKTSMPEDMGITWANSTERFAEVQAMVEEVVGEMVQTVSDHLRSTLAVGLSPFDQEQSYAGDSFSHVVEERYMRRGSDRWEYGRHAAIAVGNGAEIIKRLTAQMSGGVRVNEAQFHLYVVKRLTAALKEQPELRAAAIERISHIVYVVCVSELLPAKEPGRLARLLARLRLWSLPTPTPLALPPPEAKPLALPAPTPPDAW